MKPHQVRATAPVPPRPPPAQRAEALGAPRRLAALALRPPAYLYLARGDPRPTTRRWRPTWSPWRRGSAGRWPRCWCDNQRVRKGDCSGSTTPTSSPVRQAEAELAMARAQFAARRPRPEPPGRPAPGRVEADKARLTWTGPGAPPGRRDLRGAVRRRPSSAGRRLRAGAGPGRGGRGAGRARQARVKAAQAALDLARLQLSYTVVWAPADGVVSRLAAREGQLVQPGQTLGQLVPVATYLVANFKETQVGAWTPASVEVRSTPSRARLHGRVESLSGGTGARFSLLPPDNASGNFVKVVERVPVRLAWASPPAGLPLRAGLSADVTVHERSTRFARRPRS